MTPQWTARLVAILFPAFLVGCIFENEPNGTTGEASTKNEWVLWEQGQAQGALYLGTKEANGEDNWIIFANAPSGYSALPEISVKSKGQCLDFHVWYCGTTVASGNW